MTDKEFPPTGGPDSDHLEHPTARNRFIMGGMPDEDYHASLKTSPIPPDTSKLFDILDGGWIERYHIKGQRMLTRQSVAEHSWRIVAIIFAVNPWPSAQLILAAAFHDVSERVTGDVPANVKQASFDIERAVHEVSLKEERRLNIRFELTEDESTLLRWADRFEGALHCWDELEMGNRKVLRTLLRYLKYCEDSTYRLSNTVHEATRIKLFLDLQTQVKGVT